MQFVSTMGGLEMSRAGVPTGTGARCQTSQYGRQRGRTMPPKSITPSPTAILPVPRPDLPPGSTLLAEGAAFRVWAPFATAASIAGTVNDWSASATPLAAEGTGWWSGVAPGARIGDQYKFVLRNSDRELWRINPYAHEVTSSTGNAVLHDRNF